LNRFLYVKRGDNQQNLIEATTQKEHDIVRNRLLLASLANMLTFLILVFAMSYYDWGRIEMPFYVLNDAATDLVVSDYLSLYINLLYGKQITHNEYQSYSAISAAVCLSNDIFCQSIFQELQWIGVLCFVVMGVGAVVQVYDIVMVVRELCGAGAEEREVDMLRYFVAIGHYLVGVTLNLFGLCIMEVQIYLGVSFWVFVGGVLLFVAVVVAQQASLNDLRKQKLILSLLQGEQKITSKLNSNLSIELSENSDAYI
jgi:hypothetical protein